jgi:hypothetical protein
VVIEKILLNDQLHWSQGLLIRILQTQSKFVGVSVIAPKESMGIDMASRSNCMSRPDDGVVSSDPWYCSPLKGLKTLFDTPVDDIDSGACLVICLHLRFLI